MTTVYSPGLGKYVEVETLDTGAKPTKRRQRESDLFIKVPLRPSIDVCKMVGPRNAFVWVLLLHMSWQAHNSTFPCPNEFMKRCGISRKVKCQALMELEAAGLITVQQSPRRSPIVTMKA
jgi:DNA-binding HxlR family transcriptional regulator